MHIEELISAIDRIPNSWVRLEAFRKVATGFDLSLRVHNGRRGRQLDAWRITCFEVREARITALDGGGLALYPSTHPAARECVARQAEIRWSGASDDSVLIGAMYKAHTAAVGDWIPFEWYSGIRAISKEKFACQGPDFLMRAYAKAIRSVGMHPRMTLKPRKPKAVRPKVLHFGDSYIVADNFTAEHGCESDAG